MKFTRFTIFEHQSLKIGEKYNEEEFKVQHFNLLENFFKEKDFPYYTIIRKGIRFCEYVGVIQIGKMMIEILPKIDNIGNEKIEEQNTWRQRLIDMIRAIHIFEINAPTSSGLKIKNNSILDLYFELFVIECEQLLHKGLIKKYRKTEGNTSVLKGSLLFGKHIQQNLIHQERFYVRSTVYDKQNLLNAVLYKTLKLLEHINTNKILKSRIGSLLLNFPEQQDIKITESFFNKIIYNRKSETYKKSVQIARMLLLNYHPDIQKGKNDILALLFDMNMLWEEFVCKSLKKNNFKNYKISPQSKRNFWQKEDSSPVKMIPDIVINKENEKMIVVLDTKWKNIGDLNPKPEDLRQMYAYSKFHENAITALVYPGIKDGIFKGHFLNETDNDNEDKSCSIIKLSVRDDIKEWQDHIAKVLLNFPSHVGLSHNELC